MSGCAFNSRVARFRAHGFNGSGLTEQPATATLLYVLFPLINSSANFTSSLLPIYSGTL
jgi:hypothetical protein